MTPLLEKLRELRTDLNCEEFGWRFSRSIEAFLTVHTSMGIIPSQMLRKFPQDLRNNSEMMNDRVLNRRQKFWPRIVQRFGYGKEKAGRKSM
jgi:hypothetical protein